MSPKKVRVVADTIKGLPAEAALVRLQFMPKAPAPVIAKLVRSAMANARHNNNVADDLLIVKSIVVEEGVALKRWKPAAFGSAHPYKKRASHVKLVLGLKSGVTLPKGVVEPEKPAENGKAEKAPAADKKDASKKTVPKKPLNTKRVVKKAAAKATATTT